MAKSCRGPAHDPSLVPAESWVEVRQVVLRAGDRAPTVPADTAETDFVALVRGFLQAPAKMGDEVEVRTLLGRTVMGQLVAVDPRNPADFGQPIPALLKLGLAARRVLDEPESR